MKYTLLVNVRRRGAIGSQYAKQFELFVPYKYDSRSDIVDAWINQFGGEYELFTLRIIGEELNA